MCDSTSSYVLVQQLEAFCRTWRCPGEGLPSTPQIRSCSRKSHGEYRIWAPEDTARLGKERWFGWKTGNGSNTTIFVGDTHIHLWAILGFTRVTHQVATPGILEFMVLVGTRWGMFGSRQTHEVGFSWCCSSCDIYQRSACQVLWEIWWFIIIFHL